MGGPPLVVRLKALMYSKLILGPKKQRPASQNGEPSRSTNQTVGFENVEAGGCFGRQGRKALSRDATAITSRKRGTCRGSGSRRS